MSRMTSSIRSFERSGPSCSPIAVDPTTSAINAVTMRRSPVVVTAATIELYRRVFRLPARINRDGQVQNDVVLRRQIGFQAGEDGVRAGCRREEALLDLVDGLEANQLVPKEPC